MVEQEEPSQQVQQDAEDLSFGDGSTLEVESDSEDLQDDEHLHEEQHMNERALDHVVGVWNEHATLESLGARDDVPLYRNRFTRYIHMLSEEGGTWFKCGREINDKYEEIHIRPKFMSPQCTQCWRPARSGAA